MLNEDKPIEKVYYSIGEVATMFNLTVSNVRFWETEFDILMPKKNAKGDRFFTKKDIENLKLIHFLLKEKGYTIEGAKKKLREGGDEMRNRLETVKSLEKIKSFLQAMKDELDKKDEVATVSPTEPVASITDTIVNEEETSHLHASQVIVPTLFSPVELPNNIVFHMPEEENSI